ASVVLVASVAGCRGSMPFGRTVQITKSSDAAEVTIESPEQRLATAKTGESTDKDMDYTQQAKSSVDGSSEEEVGQPEVAVASMSADVESLLMMPNISEGEKVALVGDSGQEVQNESSPGTESQEVDRPDIVSVAAETNKDEVIDPADEPLLELTEGMSAEQLLAALREYPAEKRERALDQFVQLVADKASESTQPNAVSGQIANALHNEMTLPDVLEESAGESPERLADAEGDLDANESEDQPDLAFSITDETSDVDIEMNPTTEGSTDMQVETAQNKIPSAETVVEATTEEGADTIEGNEVAQVSVELPAETAQQEVMNSKPTIQGELTQEQLLSALILALQEPKMEESESERHERLVKLSHLLVLAGNPESAMISMEGMTPEEQSFMRHQLQGLWHLIDPEGHPNTSQRLSFVATEFREAAKLAGAATKALDVKRLTFCTEIEAYGQIRPFDENRFKKGQQVILYCEVENFKANQNETGFEMHLQGSYEIYDSENQRIFNQVLPADRQCSANYLRDYFVAYQMFLPSDLASGRYTLKLTMEDLVGTKYGQGEVNFEIEGGSPQSE
ncbi:MAG: hypothetical protein VXZ38_04270, partial [Planctomycetota bacterium]|nr:hypothetical protein [Planctomycetota bacterium]